MGIAEKEGGLPVFDTIFFFVGGGATKITTQTQVKISVYTPVMEGIIRSSKEQSVAKKKKKKKKKSQYKIMF